MTQIVTQSAISVNPATGEETARYAFQNAAEAGDLLARAKDGFERLAGMAVGDRCDIMSRMAAVLRENLELLARHAVIEMGKPISQARSEIEKCAMLCLWCAEHGGAYLADEATSIGPNAYIQYRPLGAILAVMPWNFPFWQVMRGAAGILLGGNAYVLKHAPNVQGCARLLDHMWQEAGLPHGAFTVLNADNDTVARVIADSRIAGVVVTGSVRAGSSIASLAGASLKKSVLELGGSDPFIVLKDADIRLAVEAAVAARFQNSGQVCIAAKRIILEEPIASRFTALFIDAVRSLAIGDPMDGSTYIGPMARHDLRNELLRQIDDTVAQGAELLLGGVALPRNGYFFAPTVLGNVKPGMTTFKEETFGPVASLVIADDAAQAIDLANNSEYGLSAALWTADQSAAKRAAERLQVGSVFINGYAASDPRVPIGGVKKSGYGRELSHFGIREFLNPKTVWLNRL
jgi:succinate-semialdehyde dehydrogenase